MGICCKCRGIPRDCEKKSLSERRDDVNSIKTLLGCIAFVVAIAVVVQSDKGKVEGENHNRLAVTAVEPNVNTGYIGQSSPIKGKNDILLIGDDLEVPVEVSIIYIAAGGPVEMAKVAVAKGDRFEAKGFPDGQYRVGLRRYGSKQILRKGDSFELNGGSVASVGISYAVR